MVGQKLFKTRLCILYRKGQCYRQTCSFAHGDAELRRYNPSSSFNGRRDYHNADLREKLGSRQRSPPRDYSSPRSLKKSDWGQRKRHVDNDSDYSGSLRLSDGAERQSRERKHSDVHDEQLGSEIDMLEDHRQQLQMYLEESVQEADSLNSRIEELEMQLSAEKEECKRISSKMKKFVKANIRHARIQDELKRSEDRVERLGDELGSDARNEEEDMSINILSDEETLMGPKDSPRRDGPLGLGPRKDDYKASPSNKRMRFQTDENSKQASWAAGKRVNLGNMRSERWDPHTKNSERIRAEPNGMRNYDRKPMPMPMQRKNNFTPKKKVKDMKSSRMVANMMDEEDEKLDEKENSSVVLPPPPPLPSLSQSKGKDESETADADDEELVDVDIV